MVSLLYDSKAQRPKILDIPVKVHFRYKVTIFILLYFPLWILPCIYY